MVSTNLKQEEMWYVAIARDCNGSYNFFTAENLNVEFFRSFLLERGFKAVAELEGLTEREMDKIMGYKIIPTDDGMLREENAVKIGPEYLKDLTVKLNQNDELDPKAELEKLYEIVKQNP